MRYIACVAATSFAAVAFVTAADVSAAPADTSATITGDSLQEVVVTAQFRRENQQQTPIAMSVVSGATLEARNLSSVIDIAPSMPNVSFTQASGNYGPAVQAFIRGVGQFDSNLAFEPGVGMYVDDVYHGTLLGSTFDLLDLDRVEVLRGPQGTLAGKNSIGGAVKLYSVRPTGEGGYVDVGYGSFNRVNVKAVGDFTVVPDQLFVRISGVSKRADGFFTRYDYACTHPGSGLPTETLSRNCVLGTEGGQELNAARLAVRWLASESIENNTLLDVTNDNSEVPAKKLIYAHNPKATLDGVPLDSRFLTGADSYSSYADFVARPSDAAAYAFPAVDSTLAWGVSDILDVRFTDKLSLKLISALQGTHGAYSDAASATPIDVTTGYNTFGTHQYTEELRLNGQSLRDVLEWTVGAYYYYAQESLGGRRDNPLASLDTLLDHRIRAGSESAFAHGIWELTAGLRLITGLRYTREYKDFTYGILNPDGTVPSCGSGGDNCGSVGLNGLTGRYSGSKTDYRGGLEYQWTPEVMSYAEVSTGFKGGGVNPRPNYASQVRSFGAETLTAYEIGLKSDLFERRMRLNLSGFYNRYKDIQLTVRSCPQYSPTPTSSCSLPINGGDARVYGAELEMELHPLGGLELDASMSYLNFAYTSLSQDAVKVGVRMGMINAYTPREKGSLGVQYTIAAGSAGSITTRVDGSYQSVIYTDAAVNSIYNRVAGYALLNGHLTWSDASGKWESSLNVNNMLNRFYYISKSDLVGPAGIATADVGTPRTWLLSVRRRF